MADRLTPAEILIRAGTGLGKIDRWGRRGVTMVSADEIEAMACALALAGIAPIYPGDPMPTVTTITTTNKEPQNV